LVLFPKIARFYPKKSDIDPNSGGILKVNSLISNS